MSIREILRDLIAYPSLTPNDAGCQDYLMQFLERLGFTCTVWNDGPVANFFARYGQNNPLLIFAGHTDVVPVGDLTKWDTHPFVMHEKQGMLYGRGAADMKGSIASMLMAASRFIEKHPSPVGSLGFLITSGEEGDEYAHGTPFVMAKLKEQHIIPKYCIVGEPSSQHQLGDMIKIGRRGSLTANLTLHGRQGHVAYPHLASNPIHSITQALTELIMKKWDEGNPHFPPTSFQITHIQSGGEANNIIPGELILQFNFRYSTEQTAIGLQTLVEACFKAHGLSPLIEWRLSGEPFLTQRGLLVEKTISHIENVTGLTPELSTSGGTSDARFIAPYGTEVIELGPLNQTIHKVNEHVSLADLEQLADIYEHICEALIL